MLDLKKLRFEAGDKSQNEIGEILGLPQSTISKMEKGWQKIRPEHIAKLKAAYGVELVNSCMVPDELYNSHTGAQTVQATILHRDLVDEIHGELTQPKKEDAEIIETLEAIPIVSLEQAKAPDFDVKRHVFGKSNEIERKNFNEWFVTIIKQVGLFDVVSPVVSDRMMPTYMPNDRIFSKYLLHATNDTYIEQGIYLLDTDSGNILCNVRDLDNGSLELTFDNSRKYRPRIIKKKDVKSIAQVVMTLRFGTMAFDVMDIAQIQQQMEVKDEQYRLLMEQYNKTGDRVNRVIDQNQQLINTLIDVVKQNK